MATPVEDLEAYLSRLERRFERLADGTVLVAVDADRPPIALRVVPPVLVARTVIGAVPKEGAEAQARLFRRLLELNSHDLLHASYGIEQDRIILSAALEIDNLDLNEIEAVLADIDMALVEHVPELRKMAIQEA
jgi:hypothetical protein